ncbi:conserved protein of unknown function [Pararobbsia alpina]|uniref:hypothetical protein n=1 Tax=Pararobbsia alpina TaxID=621374 RepID=UPI0039A4367F
MWDELTKEDKEQRLELYLKRVDAFLAQVREWCSTRPLVLTEFLIGKGELAMPDYVVPALRIATLTGKKLGEVLPTGALTLTGAGQICIKVSIVNHRLSFQTDPRPIVDGKREPLILDGSYERKVRRGVNGDGWYWLENRALKLKPVTEALFFELLSDGARYEIE